MKLGRHMWAMGVLTWLCCVCIGWLPPLPAVADANDEARILFEAGVTASKAGRWREASEYFQRSLSLAEKPSTWFNLAVAEVKLGNGRAALRSLDAFEQMANRADHAEMLERAVELRGQAEALRDSESTPAEEPPPVIEETPPAQQAEPPLPSPAVTTESAPPARREVHAAPADLRAPRRLLVAGVGFALGTAGTLVWWGNRADARDRCQLEASRCTNEARLERQERTALGLSIALGTVSAGLIAAGATWLAREKRRAERFTADLLLGRHGASSIELRLRY